MWHVLLGAHHPVTQQFSRYRAVLITQEKRLERVVPRDPDNVYIVPALLARVTQLELNHWLYSQIHSANPVPIASFTEVFQEIEREHNWEPTFPPRYLISNKNKVRLPTEISLAGTETTDASDWEWRDQWDGGNTHAEGRR